MKGQQKRESENMAKSPKQCMVHGLLRRLAALGATRS